MSEITNNDEFQTKVLEAELPVLVDFSATWCGPCRMLAPTIAAIEEDYAGKLDVHGVDIDRNRGIAMRYGIQAVPTLIVFKQGQPVTMMTGAYPREQIEAMIASVLEA